MRFLHREQNQAGLLNAIGRALVALKAIFTPATPYRHIVRAMKTFGISRKTSVVHLQDPDEARRFLTSQQGASVKAVVIGVDLRTGSRWSLKEALLFHRRVVPILSPGVHVVYLCRWLPCAILLRALLSDREFWIPWSNGSHKRTASLVFQALVDIWRQDQSGAISRPSDHGRAHPRRHHLRDILQARLPSRARESGISSGDILVDLDHVEQGIGSARTTHGPPGTSTCIPAGDRARLRTPHVAVPRLLRHLLLHLRHRASQGSSEREKTCFQAMRQARSSSTSSPSTPAVIELADGFRSTSTSMTGRALLRPRPRALAA